MAHAYLCFGGADKPAPYLGAFAQLTTAIASWRLSYSKVADDVEVTSSDSITYHVRLTGGERDGELVGTILRTWVHDTPEHL